MAELIETSSNAVAEDAQAELNLKILWPLARWIEDKHGTAKLEELAQHVGWSATDFDASTRWTSYAQVNRFLYEARPLVKDDDEFVEACGYRFEESMGAVRHMVWALSEQQFFEAAAKMSKVLTRVSRFEVVKSERSEFVVRYYSDLAAESRLMCLSRHAAWVFGPTMWNMPRARLEEHGCVAHGDPYCEYRLRWFDRSRRYPILLGLVAGGLGAFAFAQAHAAWLAPLTLPMLGGLLGYVIELRRASRANVKFAEEVNQVLRQLGQDEAEARSEIVALNQRQREWARLMEGQVNERTATLEKIVEGLDGLQQSRVSTIRGFSHDLRNPLFVVRGNAQFLRERIKDGEEGEALRDVEMAAGQIESMLSKLMEVATAETGFVKLTPKPLAVAPLAEVFRRRLKALVHGRDIKASVFTTREAPESIVIDHLVFDRVVDNMLTNAAKYTDRGSILLEISGTPAAGVAPESSAEHFLTLKLSDTGHGITPENLPRIFRPRPASEPSGPNSYGIGLSSVVRLLGQIGGRMHVMSKPGAGTTFWAHFPASPPEARRPSPGDDNLEAIIGRVVTIRKQMENA